MQDIIAARQILAGGEPSFVSIDGTEGVNLSSNTLGAILALAGLEWDGSEAEWSARDFGAALAKVSPVGLPVVVAQRLHDLTLLAEVAADAHADEAWILTA